MSVLSELVEKIDACVATLKSEVAEFDSGKKAAAGTLRKAAQNGKNIFQAVRVETMKQLKAMPTKKRAPKTETPTTPAS